MALETAEPYIYRFRIRGIALGQAIIQHFDWEPTPVPVPTITPEMQFELLIALRNRWQTEFMPLLPAEFELQFTELQEVIGIKTPPESGPLDYSTYFGINQVAVSTVGQGTHAGTVLPTVFAASARRVPLVANKYFRSSTRLSPLVEQDVIEQELDDIQHDSLEAAYNNFRADVVIVGPPVITFVHAMFSPKHQLDFPGLGDSPVAHSTRIQAYIQHYVVSTQRSRRPALLGD